jgi:hypothetical protein
VTIVRYFLPNLLSVATVHVRSSPTRARLAQPLSAANAREFGPDVEYHASNAPEKREESAMTAFGTMQRSAASKSVDLATML